MMDRSWNWLVCCWAIGRFDDYVYVILLIGEILWWL